MTSLRQRRERGDLIQMYTILNGIEIVDWHTGPVYAPERNTRSAARNDKCLVREVFSSRNANDFAHFVSVRHNFFLNRGAEHWNRLTNTEVSAQGLNGLKARLDRILASGC